MPKFAHARSRSELIAAAEQAWKPYPWDDCIADQKADGASQESAEKICGSIKAKNSAVDGEDALAAPPPPPAEKAPAAQKAPEAADPAAADSAVSDAIAGIAKAVEAAIAAQKADPDTSDPKDETIAAALDSINEAVQKLTQDQSDDSAEHAPPSTTKTPPVGDKPGAPAPPKAAQTAAGAPPPPAPKDVPAPKQDPDTGDIDDDAKCANADCGHLASSHLDDDTNGKNTGACQMTSCACLGMQLSESPNKGTGGNSPGAIDEDEGDFALAPPGAVPDAPGPAEPSPEKPPTLNEPPAIPGGDNVGPAFFIPVAIIEGQPTGDGRSIAAGALDWRTPPVPLMGLSTETHDPMGFDLNDPAVICGRIDSFERVPGEGDTQVIQAKGFFLANDDGAYFASLCEQMGRVGVSADVLASEVDVQVGDIDDTGWPTELTEQTTAGTILGLTICPYAAFEGAYIVLGDGSSIAEAIPQAAQTASGAVGVHFLTLAECEPCASGAEVLIASGAPVHPPKAWFEDPAFTPEDGRLVEILDKRGKLAVGGKYACPLTVEESGRVYGHLAPWGVCHTGTQGQCVTAPTSAVNYAHFKRGQTITTAEGEKVRVGVITCDAGHAELHGISAASAMAHYDNTATACCDVNIGEDEYGIWVAGAVRPDAKPEQIRKLTASSLSGDWRQLGGQLELVAALAVNQPGFPLAVVADGRQEALVAAGGQMMQRLRAPKSEPERSPLERALAPLLRLSANDARTRIYGMQARNARERVKALST